MMYMKVPPPEDGLVYREEEIAELIKEHLYLERNILAEMMLEIAEKVDDRSADVLTQVAIAVASRNNMKGVYDHTVQ